MYLGDVFVPIFKLLSCIFIIFLVGAIINIIVDKIRGVSNQQILRKRNISNSDIEILLIALNKIKGYKKIFIYNKYVIRITEYGIDAILVCDYYGILYGFESSSNWKFKNDSKYDKINNPLIEFQKYLETMQTKIDGHDINKYILLGGNTILNISFKKIEVLRRNNIFYKLSTKRIGKKYTTQEVDKIYQKINM